jgi:hypothetical protein
LSTDKDGTSAVDQEQATGIPNAAAAESGKQSIARPMMTLSGLVSGMVYRCRDDGTWIMTFLDGSVEALPRYRPDQLIGNREAAYGDLIEPGYRERLWRPADCEWRRFQHNGRTSSMNLRFHGSQRKRIWDEK